MELANVILAATYKWYHLVLLLGLIGVIIFYVLYRRRQM